MKDNIFIRFLYNTIPGRIMLKGLVAPEVSRQAAKFFSSPASARLVPFFVNKYGIHLDEYVVPEDGFKSFNEFFIREQIEKVAIKNADTDAIYSPCDGLLTLSRISDKLTFNIKHTRYSVDELIGDSELAEELQGGTALIFRLTPAHYHRYSYSVEGCLREHKRIEGILHSVKPICHMSYPVFVQNSRELEVIDNPSLGKVVQMEIGALLVGRISNHAYAENDIVFAGQEKGYFEYGGSSIVVLTSKQIVLPSKYKTRIDENGEMPVRIGERLGRIRCGE